MCGAPRRQRLCLMTTTAPQLNTSPLLPGVSPDRVSVPGSDRWDEARSAFNLLVDQRPVAIVLAEDEQDVVAAVRYARERGLRVSGQSTGHNAGPLGALDDTI